jgi:hypothetical protein
MRHNMQASAVMTKEYQMRYKSAPRITSNVIFGTGDGILGEYARDEAICRWKVRLEKDTAACRKKKKGLTKLLIEHNKFKVNMSKEDLKWTISKLALAIKCKMHLDYKEVHLEQWGKIKQRPMPQPSPVSSDNKDTVDEEASNRDNNETEALVHGVAHGVLVFGDDIHPEDSGREFNVEE